MRIFFGGEHCARCLIDIILLFQQWVPRPVPVAPAPWEASGVQEAEPEQEGDRKLFSPYKHPSRIYLN